MSGLVTPDGRSTKELRLDAPAPLGLIREKGIGAQRRWIKRSNKTGILLLSIIATVDDGSMHISIACPDRYPTWQEITAVREWGFDPDTEVVMVLARRGEYVNLHPNCFHLWESACGREGR